MIEVNGAIIEGLGEEIGKVFPSRTLFVRRKKDGLVLSGDHTIHITLLPYGIHILRFGAVDRDCVLDYEDPRLIEKMINKIRQLNVW